MEYASSDRRDPEERKRRRRAQQLLRVADAAARRHGEPAAAAARTTSARNDGLPPSAASPPPRPEPTTLSVGVAIHSRSTDRLGRTPAAVVGRTTLRSTTRNPRSVPTLALVLGCGSLAPAPSFRQRSSARSAGRMPTCSRPASYQPLQTAAACALVPSLSTLAPRVSSSSVGMAWNSGSPRRSRAIM